MNARAADSSGGAAAAVHHASQQGGTRCPHTAALQAATDAVVLPSVADPRADMKRERTRCLFDAHALACELYGGEEAVERRARLAALAKSEPLFDKSPIPFLSREQRYVRGAKVGVPWLSSVAEQRARVGGQGLIAGIRHHAAAVLRRDFRTS